MVSSLTAPAGDCQQVTAQAQTAPAGAVPVASQSLSGLPAPRVVSERTVAVYTGVPVVTGVSMSVAAAIPNGAGAAPMPGMVGPLPAAMPNIVSPVAAMSTGHMLYGQPCAGAMTPAPPCGIPAMGALLPLSNSLVPPAPPRNLAAGLPDPASIEYQKSVYNARLDEELRHGSELLKLQQKQHTDYIHQAAEAQRRQMLCQIEQNAKEQELQLSHKIHERQRSLQQEYQNQKFALEKQANDLHMEYQRRKAQDEMLMKQYEMQKAHQEDQIKLADQSPSKGMFGAPYPTYGAAGPDPLTPMSFASTADMAAFSPHALGFGSPASTAHSAPASPYAAFAVTQPLCMAAY